MTTIAWWAAGAAWADEPAAAAAEVAEEWSDGLTRRPVRSPAVVAEGVAVTNGEVNPWFGALSVQYGAPVGDGLSLGASLDARAVRADGLAGPVLGLQSVGVEGWLVADLANTRHGFGLAYGEPTGAVAGWYPYHPIEGGRRAVGTYDVLVDTGRFDLSIDLRVGLGQVYAAQVGGTIAGVVELDPHVALTAGLQAGFQPTATFLVGVDVRPVAHLEVGAGLGIPYGLFDDRATTEVQPGVRVKSWF